MLALSPETLDGPPSQKASPECNILFLFEIINQLPKILGHLEPRTYHGVWDGLQVLSVCACFPETLQLPAPSKLFHCCCCFPVSFFLM